MFADFIVHIDNAQKSTEKLVLDVRDVKEDVSMLKVLFGERAKRLDKVEDKVDELLRK